MILSFLICKIRFIIITVKFKEGNMWESNVKVAQSCPTLCNPMDYTVHGILQARILEWVTFPFSRGSSQPRDWIYVSWMAGGFFTSWATREAQYVINNHNDPSSSIHIDIQQLSWYFSCFSMLLFYNLYFKIHKLFFCLSYVGTSFFLLPHFPVLLRIFFRNGNINSQQ